jgi:hypothetical protein
VNSALNAVRKSALLQSGASIALGPAPRIEECDGLARGMH